MDDLLNGFFGVDASEDGQAKDQKINDFVSRVTQGNPAEGYDTQEALVNYANVASKVSDGSFEKLAADALSRFSPEQRQEFAALVQQHSNLTVGSTGPEDLARVTTQLRSDNGLLGSLLGGGGGVQDLIGGLLGGGGSAGASASGGITDLLNNPIVKALLGLIAANAMGQISTNRNAGITSNDGGIGGLLDGILGGDSNSAAQSGGIGGMLDGILGGDNDQPQPVPTPEPQPQPRPADSGSRRGGGILDKIFGRGKRNDPQPAPDAEQRDGKDDVPDFGDNIKPRGM